MVSAIVAEYHLSLLFMRSVSLEGGVASWPRAVVGRGEARTAGDSGQKWLPHDVVGPATPAGLFPFGHGTPLP